MDPTLVARLISAIKEAEQPGARPSQDQLATSCHAKLQYDLPLVSEAELHALALVFRSHGGSKQGHSNLPSHLPITLKLVDNVMQAVRSKTSSEHPADSSPQPPAKPAPPHPVATPPPSSRDEQPWPCSSLLQPLASSSHALLAAYTHLASALLVDVVATVLSLPLPQAYQALRAYQPAAGQPEGEAAVRGPSSPHQPPPSQPAAASQPSSSAEAAAVVPAAVAAVAAEPAGEGGAGEDGGEGAGAWQETLAEEQDEDDVPYQALEVLPPPLSPPQQPHQQTIMSRPWLHHQQQQHQQQQPAWQQGGGGPAPPPSEPPGGRPPLPLPDQDSMRAEVLARLQHLASPDRLATLAQAPPPSPLLPLPSPSPSPSPHPLPAADPGQPEQAQQLVPAHQASSLLRTQGAKPRLLPSTLPHHLAAGTHSSSPPMSATQASAASSTAPTAGGVGGGAAAAGGARGGLDPACQVLPVLRVMGLHPDTAQLQPLLRAYCGLLAAWLAAGCTGPAPLGPAAPPATPDDLEACLGQVWEALGVAAWGGLQPSQVGSGGAGQGEVGGRGGNGPQNVEAAQSGVTQRGGRPGVLLPEAVAALTFIAQLSRLASSGVGAALWRQLHSRLLPFMERCLLDLAAAAQRAARGEALGGDELEEEEEVVSLAVLFYLEHRPAGFRACQSLLGAGLARGLALLLAPLGSRPSCEALRLAALMLAAGCPAAAQFMLAVPGVGASLCSAAFLPGGCAAAHGAVWRSLTPSQAAASSSSSSSSSREGGARAGGGTELMGGVGGGAPRQGSSGKGVGGPGPGGGPSAAMVVEAAVRGGGGDMVLPLLALLQLLTRLRTASDSPTPAWLPGLQPSLQRLLPALTGQGGRDQAARGQGGGQGGPAAAAPGALGTPVKLKLDECQEDCPEPLLSLTPTGLCCSPTTTTTTTAPTGCTAQAAAQGEASRHPGGVRAAAAAGPELPGGEGGGLQQGQEGEKQGQGQRQGEQGLDRGPGSVVATATPTADIAAKRLNDARRTCLRLVKALLAGNGKAD